MVSHLFLALEEPSPLPSVVGVPLIKDIITENQILESCWLDCQLYFLC
jgi:hypothetical protein